MAEIRDSKLYRADFNTFEAYCKEKWGWSRPYAYQLIDAAGVVKAIPVSAMADKITSERQARELSKVEPEHRAEVLEKAVERGPVTLPALIPGV